MRDSGSVFSWMTVRPHRMYIDSEAVAVEWLQDALNFTMRLSMGPAVSTSFDSSFSRGQL
jgi:hypothetical protein